MSACLDCVSRCDSRNSALPVPIVDGVWLVFRTAPLPADCHLSEFSPVRILPDVSSVNQMMA
jgi:hypothetical protein